MKTVVFTGPGRLDVREVDLPMMAPRQVLVKTCAVGLCTLEQRFYKGSSPESYPFLGGHEVAGRVVEVGAQAATDARPGDIVSLALLERCGSCYYCRRGMDNLCVRSTGARPGSIPGPAGLSEFVLAEDYQVYTPPQRSLSTAAIAELALAEPVACVIRSAQMPPLHFGDLALVQGAGIMGLLHTQLLKQRGVRVIVAEPNESRRHMALQAGADWVVDPLRVDLAQHARELSEGHGANAAFFTAGGVPAIEQAIRSLVKGGWLCLYGSVHPRGPIAIDPNEVHYNELVITGSFSHTKASFQQAVTMIGSRKIDVSAYVSECVPFPQIDFALQQAIREDTYRVVVTFDT